ncbi:Eco57I restriction-modification methylase domain-containing protein [Erythrobacter sp. NE805]|uniref:Eco57I restriction-modification methylase domain-containing protein n=1 Tax=Erythrobacter sp. NE805 TaxID=3389875 RepID=UPI00396AF823
MTDAALFTAGSLFSQDYLKDGIRRTSAYLAVDVTGFREQLGALLSAFPHASHPNEAMTESEVVWPILGALGWSSWLTQQNLSASGRDNVPDGLLFIDEDAKALASQTPEEWKRYQFGSAIVESKRWGRALDRAEGRSKEARETPSTQMLRYLKRIDDVLTQGALRWGILTNGARWRLYFSGARSTIDDYLEIDLARVAGLESDLLDAGVTQDERDHWLRVFVAMFSRSAFEREAADAPSFHDLARDEAAFYEKRVAQSLSDLVFDRLYPALGKAIAEHAPADTSLEAIRNATLILLYRLLFILYAEDRGLLPVKDSRYDDYALRVTREDVKRRMDASDTFSSVASTIWDRFSSLAIMIDKGDPSVGLPPYNGGLFNAGQTPLLGAIRLPDTVMAEAIDILSFEQQGGVRRYINYRDLSVQQLGSIYERLLEFKMDRVDGEFVIQPNIFARKDSGSYYTPDELVLLIIDETLQPLIDDAYAAFAQAIASLGKNDSEASKLRTLEAADPAVAITRLRVCDPAMGSGHFLVSLVDRLTNQALEAVVRAQELAAEAGIEDYQSPIATEIEKIRATIWTNAQAKNWAIAEEQLDDPQLVKRMVLKRCIHGVDKNPMAVELAKVALWLHTFTVGAPLSFIDHHLHCGDSLFGLWVRNAIDKAGAAGELLYIEDLRNAERQAAVMQRIEALTDAEIAEAQSSADMWRDVEAQIGPFDSFVSFMHALDWLDLPREEKPLVVQWLDGGFGDPLPIARGKRQPEPLRAKPEEAERFTAIWRKARELIEEERFLNWQIAFPGVWRNWASAGREGGFDAVVGNPPWDMLEFEEVPWFEARDREIALTTNRAARSRRIAALRDADAPLWQDYSIARQRAGAALSMARSSGIYRELNRGRINLYKLFIERAHALVRPDGMVGLLTPSGIAADQSTAPFFRRLAIGANISALFDFENRRTRHRLEPFFPDVDSRFKFTAMIASPQRAFVATRCGFFLQAVSEIADPECVFSITAEDFARVNPNTGTAPVFRSRTDMRITTSVYERQPVLLDRSGQVDQPQFDIVFQQMLNMSSDSGSFLDHAQLEEAGAWRRVGNIFEHAEGTLLPVFEGKMVQAFDHRASDVVVSAGNVFRPGQGEDLTAEEHRDPNRSAEPRYWIKQDLVPWRTKTEWCLAFKDITAATNMRTTIAAMIPFAGAGHTLPVAIPAEGHESRYVEQAPMLLANMNSTPFDYMARQKVHGTHLAWYLLEQLPVLPPATYTRRFGPKTAAEIVRESVLELTYTAHDMAAFARDMGHVDAAGEVRAPFVWDEDRRLRLRAKLDALYFILYGIFDPENAAQSREDIRYIYGTFPIVERQEIARWGTCRSRDLALAWINALMAGQPDAEVAG